MQRPYHEQVDIKNPRKLRELCRRLPRFASDFFMGIEQVTSSRTRIAYAYDLKVFFDYVLTELPAFSGRTMDDLRVEDLDRVSPRDLEEFMEYMKYYVPGNSDDEESSYSDRTNKELGIKRKMAGLRSFYNYFYRRELIKTNPPSLVKLPKTHEKVITRLDVDEVARLLDVVEDGGTMTDSGQILRDMRAGKCALLSIGGIGEETGGYKGYGFTTIVEILSAALSGGPFMKELSGKNPDGTNRM